ncbi:MAG: bifunctional 2-polyprenyl-6-hydroxyphenol methylase/3-demethylubiquinol 3-O-methyltransferase UbiG [Alphaproteobacteria bacterium]|jgi:2-polyprenyl-6-hydroxyphenyl methylase/3-demethylubiquinone-9 3-methyltransferase|nr:bifunctional 2-polyprenyl-6-hydroxyphenol methylase/3-demethylubiquinol 3-O-methyltransferase UbiG [Alphaproteobacteria bacterium]
MKSSIESEVEKFSSIAEDWWKKDGKFQILHNFNKVRVSYIADVLRQHNLQDVEILDVGCGGGILAESFAELGYKITGIDASGASIAAAKRHAEESGLDINYINILPEDYLAQNCSKKFKVVFVMEIIEHVNSAEEFLATVSQFLEDDGLLFFSTINRNLKSLVLAKYAAEYILNWVPKGTHEHAKFIKPSELNALLVSNGVEVSEVRGIKLNPLSRTWELATRPDINYIGFAKKAK